MGNKIHPNALRLGYIHDWQSKWFSTKDAPALIGEDFKIRNASLEDVFLHLTGRRIRE